MIYNNHNIVQYISILFYYYDIYLFICAYNLVNLFKHVKRTENYDSIRLLEEFDSLS